MEWIMIVVWEPMETQYNLLGWELLLMMILTVRKPMKKQLVWPPNRMKKVDYY